jgi:hypothetical protein
MKLLKLLWRIIVISFFLNIIWENAQATLYEGYTHFLQHFMTCLRATLGDVLLVLLIYLITATIKRDMRWPHDMTKGSAMLALLVGALVGAGMEAWSIDSGRWSYTTAMPIVPILDIGLLPLLQMMLLPLLSFYMAVRFARVNSSL